MNESIEPEDLDNLQPGYLGVSPTPSRLPEKGERVWVDRSDQLLQAVSVLEQSQLVAVDAEFTQVRSLAPKMEASSAPASASSNRLALLQLAIEKHCFVVDAWRLGDLAPLAAVLGDSGRSILLHGAGADMQVMAARGLSVAHYYDLEAASRSIFGSKESSLAAMLQRAFNMRLDKSLQRTDWTRRPLPSAMISYAARDAEMTLALYSWLDQHYRWALQLHEHIKGQKEPVAAWIEPFLRGTSPVPVDAAVAEAKAQGLLSEEQILADCRAALARLVQPMLRSRLLRLIGDLSLVQLVPEIEPLLRVQAADERAAAARALGRLKVEQGEALLRPLLQDPVYDVRKAAQTALRNLTGNQAREQRPIPTKLSDGTRSWSIGDTGETASTDDESDWKARLRAMLGE